MHSGDSKPTARAVHRVKFLQFVPCRSGKKSAKKNLDPDREPDQHQNLISCCQSDIPPLQKMSSKFVDNVSSYPSDKTQEGNW